MNNLFHSSLSESEILRLIRSNELAILEAQRKASDLARDNTSLRVALNRRKRTNLMNGFPVSHIAVIVGGTGQ